jgi:sialate O-acetylesterase
MIPSRTIACWVLLAAAAGRVSGEVRVNPIFTDHAVLQRGVAVPVWGTASAGEPVRVSFAGQSVSTTTAADGRWSVRLAPIAASADPASMAVAGRDGDPTVTLNDLLVGDVWVCSGQSNMERQLGPRPPQPPIDDWRGEVARADHPTLRLFAVTEGGAPTPRTNVIGGPGWRPCTPRTAIDFSAVAYFFGRDLQADVRVPIGLIQTAYGGTPAADWTSREALAAVPEFAPAVAQWDRAVAAYPARRAAFDADLAKRRATTAATTTRPARAPRAPGNPSVLGTTTLFNGMIAPLMPYAVRGAVWYQGENDADPLDQAVRYRRLLPLMVADWRHRWGEGDFPFLFVQIAPYAKMRPEIRESQRVALAAIPVAAMVVLTDAGQADNIHPPHKQVVGARLALAARAVAYGEPVEYSGPLYQSLAVDGDRAAITFTHADGMRTTDGGPVRGFEVAGADGRFVPATAEVRGATVVVHADGVPRPAVVRFGWAPVPDVNLFNAAGLPASPFTTAAE